MFADCLVAEHIHSGKHPATAAGLLVGTGNGIDAVGELGIECGCILIVHGKSLNLAVDHSVAECLVGCVATI